jgi:hypothetical protein
MCGIVSPKTLHSLETVIGHVKSGAEYVVKKRKKTHQAMGFKQHTIVSSVIFHYAMLAAS